MLDLVILQVFVLPLASIGIGIALYVVTGRKLAAPAASFVVVIGYELAYHQIFSRDLPFYPTASAVILPFLSFAIAVGMEFIVASRVE
ncbi:hypothetical protein ACFO4L_11280 [Bacillus daqingensis]|uniref:Uncharacterized protein n=1 Tax=Bacillus daqingensis TaxID=872396 RepID=A0ABV9NXW2_9BACI